MSWSVSSSVWKPPASWGTRFAGRVFLGLGITSPSVCDRVYLMMRSRCAKTSGAACKARSGYKKRQG